VTANWWFECLAVDEEFRKHYILVEVHDYAVEVKYQPFGTDCHFTYLLNSLFQVEYLAVTAGAASFKVRCSEAVNQFLDFIEHLLKTCRVVWYRERGKPPEAPVGTPHPPAAP